MPSLILMQERIKLDKSNNGSKINISLIYLGISRREYPFLLNWLYSPSAGIYYLHAILSGDEYYNIQIINQPCEQFSIEEIITRIQDFNSDVILFTQFFTTRNDIKCIAERCHRDAIIGVGGHDVTLNCMMLSKEELENEYAHVDFIWQGEVENGFKEFIKSFKKSGTPVVVNNLNNRITNLNELPVLSHDDYDGKVGFMVTSRGCLKRGCDFCTTPLLYKDGWKARSVRHVFKEMEYLKQNGKTIVNIFDDNFFGTRKADVVRGIEIVKKAKDLGMFLFIMTSVQQIYYVNDLGLLGILRGVVPIVFIGVENVSKSALEKLGKRVSPGSYHEKTIKVLSSLYSNGISPFLGFINYFPDATFNEILCNAKFLYENFGEAANFHYLTNKLNLLDGTLIQKRYISSGLKYHLNSSGYQYEYLDPKVGYSQYIFSLLQEYTRVSDFLLYEASTLLYMNQLQDDTVGKEFNSIKLKICRKNYIFFVDIINKIQNNMSFDAIMDFVAQEKNTFTANLLLLKRYMAELLPVVKYYNAETAGFIKQYLSLDKR